MYTKDGKVQLRVSPNKKHFIKRHDCWFTNLASWLTVFCQIRATKKEIICFVSLFTWWTLRFTNTCYIFCSTYLMSTIQSIGYICTSLTPWNCMLIHKLQRAINSLSWVSQKETPLCLPSEMWKLLFELDIPKLSAPPSHFW